MNTVSQAQDPRWFEERRLQLTASNFGKVHHRKKVPTEEFFKKHFGSEESFKCCINSSWQTKWKKVVGFLYARKMQKHVHKNFTVYDSGLVVNPAHPYLGATPDGKVFEKCWACQIFCVAPLLGMQIACDPPYLSIISTMTPSPSPTTSHLLARCL